ncbi:S8 family serine peptidase [Sediminitomix flava]|uniref:Subtilisin family serine protease n=1 Tax=Sediminitomix flava TaxID=379075 RepID=A0A316A006_SEDFL|nr:S8 family serine peptidase [Sediminitomix flava]PWJ42977.1 subtilisin family serine protease [Sediminitomix flava]
MRGLLFILLIISCTSISAQQRYWLSLIDKGQESSIQSKKENISAPISPLYLNEIKGKGISIIVQSKWLNAVSVELDEIQLEWAKRQTFITEVSPVDTDVVIHSLERDSFGELGLYSAIKQLKPEAFFEENLDGKGVKIGVIDAGYFEADSNKELKSLFENDRILAHRDFVNPTKEEFFSEMETSLDSHGTTVLTMMAGKPSRSSRKGLAPEAYFYLARTDHGVNEFRGEEDYWVQAIEWLDSLGVKLVNTSLGYASGFDDPKEDYAPSQMDGKTSKIALASEIAVNEKGMLLVVSAGNEGLKPSWRVLSTPADAKGVLSVGATDLQGRKMGYSSIGPEDLAYLKPNVSCYSLNGTSFSAPVITGFVACLWQKFPEASNKEIYDAIEKSSNLYPYGNNFVGYGVPDAAKALQILEGKTVINSRLEKAIGLDEVALRLKKRGGYVTVFDKKDDRNVLRQRAEKVNKSGDVTVKRYKNCKRSTVSFEGSSIEIIWEEE